MRRLILPSGRLVRSDLGPEQTLGPINWMTMLMLVDANETAHPAVSDVVGPHRRPLTLADLPSPDTKRWVIRRKAEVVAAVRGGLLSLEEACRRYALNADEFASWQHCIDRFGLAGLRTTWTQFYHGRYGRPENHPGASELAHIPAKWMPVRRQYHAPLETFRARPESEGTEHALTTAGSGIVKMSGVPGPDQTRPTCKRAGVDDCAGDRGD
jgi:hypothetical protein